LYVVGLMTCRIEVDLRRLKMLQVVVMMPLRPLSLERIRAFARLPAFFLHLPAI
jgi:hypothetical protein